MIDDDDDDDDGDGDGDDDDDDDDASPVVVAGPGRTQAFAIMYPRIDKNIEDIKIRYVFFKPSKPQIIQVSWQITGFGGGVSKI